MAPHFIFPHDLRALEGEHEDGCIHALNPIALQSFHLSELEEFVKGVSFDLSDKELFCIQEQDVFDRVYSIVAHFNTLTPACKNNIVESLRSNFSVLLPNIDALARINQGEDDGHPVLDQVASYGCAFKIYMCFLLNIVTSEESRAGSTINSSKAVGSTRKKQLISSWNWEVQRARILNVIANSLEINLTLLFGSSDPDENFLSFIAKNTFSMFENASLLKDPDTKVALCRIIGTCATKYHYIAQSCASIIHLIHRYDFVSTHMADAVAGAEKKYSDGSLATSLIREVGRTNPKDYVKDNVGADNIGHFLVELADRMPKLISNNIGLLVPHFGGESYKIRNALVGVLGKLVSKAYKDIEGDVSSKSVRLRAKQAMLEILLERCRDVSAYTRNRVLQVWAELCEDHSVSIGLWNEVAAIAAGRLEDKSAIVRKSALNLLVMMLQHNPFGPQLRTASFEATLEEYKKKLNEVEPHNSSENISNGVQSNKSICDIDGEFLHLKAEGANRDLQESLPDSCFPHMEDGNAQGDASVPDFGNIELTRALVASLEAGLRFSKCIAATMPTLVQLMASTSSTDVENTILLLMRCKQFQIDGSEACLRKMLPLVFSQDKSIYEAVENAFITIYIWKNPKETATNLLNLALDSSIGDLAALESIVGILVSKGDISTSMIAALWDFFCFNVNGTSAEQSRGALSVLCMAAKSSPMVLSSHLQDIIDIGFGRWAQMDPLLARTACIALQRLSKEDRNKLLSSNGSRVFATLESVITSSWLPESIWYGAADKAVGAVYILHPTPETLGADLVKKSLSSVFDCSGGDALQNDIGGCDSKAFTAVQVAKLSKFLYVLSSVAMNQLVYIESCVRKIQKQKAKKEKTNSESQDAGRNGTATVDALKENNINAELGIAASDDMMLDFLSERAEKEIVSGVSAEKNLIGSCAPFLSKLCREFSLMQKYPELQASAMLALCRLMIIDSDFCNSNLQLLFTVVENAPSETVRSNCTIALGDLAVRFPNLLEPWTEKMYARLRDPSIPVRKNAVLVLSHLILNDMMKVKGYINEMAVRLEDEDGRICNLAKLFFHELSKKGSNPIYNLLPDILGKLSAQDLQRESFCNIMQFLIGSIKKDKQMESLVEKLCNRFGGVTDIRQWEYISYCLSQLAFTEKGMKKLMEAFKTYEHVLSEDSVMDHFRNIISKGKKFAKPELKSSIEEFEEKLDKVHTEKKEQEITARNAQFHQLKIASISSVAAGNPEGERTTGDASGDGEVIDSAMEGSQEATHSMKKATRSKPEEYSSITSELTESKPDSLEVQSPIPRVTGASKARNKKTNMKRETASTRKSTRTKKRVLAECN